MLRTELFRGGGYVVEETDPIQRRGAQPAGSLLLISSEDGDWCRLAQDRSRGRLRTDRQRTPRAAGGGGLMLKRPAKVKRWGVAWRGVSGRYFLDSEVYLRKSTAETLVDATPAQDGIAVPVYIAVDAAWWERNGP